MPVKPGVKGEASPQILGLPRRELLEAGGIHYAAPFGSPGVMCGARGEVKKQQRARGPVDCERCLNLARWVWSHRRPHNWGPKAAAKRKAVDG